MPILKVEILSTKIEINYEEKELDQLLILIENFKKRLIEFPNNGRISNNALIFLSALKAEDELDEFKKIVEKNIVDKDQIDKKKLIIENLNKEIILLKDEVNELNILKLSDQNNTYSAIKEINNLSNTIASIKEKIKESM